MVLTFLPIVTVVSFEQPLKALSPIFTTVYLTPLYLTVEGMVTFVILSYSGADTSTFPVEVILYIKPSTEKAT